MSIITLQDYYNDSDCPELVDAYDLSTFTSLSWQTTKQNNAETKEVNNQM